MLAKLPENVWPAELVRVQPFLDQCQANMLVRYAFVGKFEGTFQCVLVIHTLV
jgi:hypothetical protein